MWTVADDDHRRRERGHVVTIQDVTQDEDQLVNGLVDQLLDEFPPAATDPVAFGGALFDLGLAWVHFPVGHGGLGLTPKHQLTINERMAAAGAPNLFVQNPLAYGMCGPTIAEWGSEDQKQRYLRRMITVEDKWCQLFSEPGAGSDVAGLATSAVRDGDEWIVNGQKVWTSLASEAAFGLLIARTDPKAYKHNGITAFVIDMHAPGVEVRPLRQMTGDAEFCEVYFTDARIPVSEMLGGAGEGWRVSITTLMNERSAIGGTVPPRGSGPIAAAVQAWQQLPESRKTAPQLDELMKLWSRAEVLRLTNQRAAQARTLGDPGPEGSIGKLAGAEVNKDVYAFVVDLLGAEGMLFGDYNRNVGYGQSMNELPRAFLRSRANSIEGGTAEVMRNILGERMLGLPGDIRVDRNRPWSEIPRN
jgi:alkylation response protein AidB-like acyl-CoA dehydrogenase